MTWVRRHLAAVVGVLLALAVGVVLGSGPLSGSAADDAADADTTGGASSAGGAGGASAGAGEDGADGAPEQAWVERFAAAAGARAYGGALAPAPVALVSMPDADRDLLKAVSDQVKAAGGRVTGRYVVQPALLDPDGQDDVDAATASVLPEVTAAGLVLDPALQGAALAGRLLGEAVAVPGGAPVAPDATSTALRRTLNDAGLVTSPSVPVADAPLVLVVLGPGADDTAGEVEVETALLAALPAAATGTVVLGDEDSATDGTLAALRRAQPAGPLVTVDDPGTALGPVSATLGLVGVLAGRTGAFGAASADGALPLG